ncbi:MAG: hypothetical protein JWM96_463 [Alphaproteobacteria bacterium]|nr:hypothetical protein [Alphaproteobacteria bacterium]
MQKTIVVIANNMTTSLRDFFNKLPSGKRIGPEKFVSGRSGVAALDDLLDTAENMLAKPSPEDHVTLFSALAKACDGAHRTNLKSEPARMERVGNVAKSLVESLPEGQVIALETYASICTFHKGSWSLWREYPDKFGLFDLRRPGRLHYYTDTMPQAEKERMPQAKNDYYIGRYEPLIENFPLAKKTKEDILYVFDLFAGNKDQIIKECEGNSRRLRLIEKFSREAEKAFGADKPKGCKGQSLKS